MLAEKETLRNLRYQQDIAIKPTDKGSMIVMLNKEGYINEGIHVHQVSSTTHYHKLTSDPTSKYTMEVKEVVGSMFCKQLTIRVTGRWISHEDGNSLRSYDVLKLLHLDSQM